jgi:flagellar biogenesis protein FliO
MLRINRGKFKRAMQERGGLAGWLLSLLRNRTHAHGNQRPRLELLERITLAPRQSLVLVEAEGRRFLVATSMDGGSAFHALDESHVNPVRPQGVRASRLSTYVSTHSSKRGLPRDSW